MSEITSQLYADPLDFLTEMYVTQMNAEDAKDRAAGIDLQADPTVVADVADQTAAIDAPVRRIESAPSYRLKAAGAALALVGLLAACSKSNATPAANVSPTPSASSSANPGMPTIPGNGQVKEETDQSLAGGGFNCGHTAEIAADGSFNYAPQIDYLNSKPELAKNLIDFQINDPNWGMGTDAWNILKTQAFPNPETPTSSVVNSNDDMNTYAHGIWTMAVNNYTGVNFTCATKNGTVEPVSEVGLKAQSHVSGFLVTAATKDAFLKAARTYPDGKPMFAAILTDVQYKDPNGNVVQIFILVTEFEACDNPNRQPEEVPPTPVPQETPAKKEQPSPAPSVVETPTPTPVPTPTPTLLPFKIVNPAKPVPGPGKTSPLPEPATSPVPDNGQPNPVGNKILNSPEPVATSTPLKVEPIPSLQPSPQGPPPAG